MEDKKIIKNKELSIWEALLPVIVLVALLAFNVFVFGDEALGGSNQFILLIGGAFAAIVGIFNKVSFDRMLEEVANNIKSTSGAILILLFVGALAGTWLVSGVIPAMRSEEHTSELQSREILVCRLLLEKQMLEKEKHVP